MKKRTKRKHFEDLPAQEAIKQINDLLSYLLSQPHPNKNDSFIRDLKQQKEDIIKREKSK